MEINKFVKRYDDMIDYSLCDKIINSTNFKEFEVAGVGDNEKNKKIRNCYIKNISKEFDDDIFKIVSSSLHRYCSDFKWCSFGIAIEDTGYNHLLYKGVEGGQYKMHVDHGDLYPRVLSCSLILNDNYEGGNFVFFDEEYLIEKKKGSVVMFPSNFCFPHAITPVLNGDRHAIITWIH